MKKQKTLPECFNMRPSASCIIKEYHLFRIATLAVTRIVNSDRNGVSKFGLIAHYGRIRNNHGLYLTRGTCEKCTYGRSPIFGERPFLIGQMKRCGKAGDKGDKRKEGEHGGSAGGHRGARGDDRTRMPGKRREMGWGAHGARQRCPGDGRGCVRCAAAAPGRRGEGMHIPLAGARKA